MRPYKKRVIISQAQLHNENGMDSDNSEDSDPQGSPLHSAQKDKTEGKGSRKKWKRKISRKQFRHHDIKLFTPGEYRSSTLLKQKDPPLTSPKATENDRSSTLLKQKDSPLVSPKTPESSKESITDAIVTSLGGITAQPKPPVIEKEGSAEENNNTNGFQNHNNAVGKHQLPAIIMENPVVRRRSLEITNAPKLSVFGNSKTTSPSEHTLSSRSQDSCDINKSTASQPVEMMIVDYEENAASCPTGNSQSFNVGMENRQHPAEELPENLSLKRRYSVEVPVDLRKKTLNAARDKERKSAPASTSKPASVRGDNEETIHEELLLAAMRGEIPALDKELSELLNSTKSQKGHSDTTHHHKKILRELEVTRLIKTALLVSKVKELQLLQKQNFNLDVMDNWLQSQREIEVTLKDDSILGNIRKEAQKILVDVYKDMFNKTKQLFGSKFNDDMLNVLGRVEPQETNRLPPNLDEIHRLRNLNLNDQTPVENAMLTKPHKLHSYRQHENTPQQVYPDSLLDIPHLQEMQHLMRPDRNKEIRAYPPYQLQKVKDPPRLEEDPRRFPTYMAMNHVENNLFLVNGEKDHGAVKKNVSRPRSKSHRNLDVQDGVQEASLKRSLSNPHNSNLDYSYVFHQPPQFGVQERIMYSRTFKTPPVANYNPGLMQDKNVKQYRNSYPPEPYPTHHLHHQPPVLNQRLEPPKLSPPSERPVPQLPIQNTSTPPKPTTIEPPKISTTTVKEVPYLESKVVKRNLVTLQERPKTMPEVIIADGSMQITKEPKPPSDTTNHHQTDAARMTVITTSSKTVSRAATPTFTKSAEDETNPEFMDWLEKLKKDEKLKSKFLSQMGISKPASTPPEYIEISDSDEEVKVKKEKPTTDFQRPTSLEITPIPLQPVGVEVRKSPVNNPAHLKRSLSKTNYVPTIPLTFPPNNYPPRTSSGQGKSIYSPEIEPISPVNDREADNLFHFPPTDPSKAVPTNLPPLIPGIIDREVVLRGRVVSPLSYPAKRKTPQTFPDDYPTRKEMPVNRKSAEYQPDNSSKRRKSLDRPQNSVSPRVAPSGKLCYIRENHMFLRYFDDTQMEMFISNLSSQDEELLRTTGIDPEKIKTIRRSSNFQLDHLGKTEIVHLPPDVEFSTKEDLPDVEEFVKESSLVERFVPKDFADFYRYVTGFQIIKNKHPVSLKTFLTMYNTNRTTELLRKYLQRLDEDSSGVIVR